MNATARIVAAVRRCAPFILSIFLTYARTAAGGAYYVTVLVLQFIPFSLCIGGGVRCGVVLYRTNAQVGWPFWKYRLPRETLVDVACVFAVAIPLFLLASAFEFLSPWNT